MTCDWCRWPAASPIFVENVRELLCAGCVALVARYRIANVRL